MSTYALIAKLFPKRIRLGFKQLLIYSGIKLDPDRFLGFIIFFGLSTAFILSTLLNHYWKIPFIPAYIVLLLAVEFAVYLVLQFITDGKAKFVENVLPDALQLMSSNIRAGLTTDKALLLSTRPEFGPLTDEIKRIGRETMAGRTLISALQKTSLRIRSLNLERTFDLIIHSLRSGGELADLLDQISNDLRDQQMIQKEIRASVLMYVIFIVIALAIGAPILYAMSGFLVELLTKNMAMIASEMPKNIGGPGASAPISMASIQLDPSFITLYSLLSLIVSAFFGSMVIGLILKGEEREGFKYLVPLLLGSVSLYFIGGYVLETVLGGMMQM